MKTCLNGSNPDTQIAYFLYWVAQEIFSKQGITRSRIHKQTQKKQHQKHQNQNMDDVDHRLDHSQDDDDDDEEEDLGLLAFSVEEDLDLLDQRTRTANEKDPQVTLQNRFQVHSVSQNVRQVMRQMLERHQGHLAAGSIDIELNDSIQK